MINNKIASLTDRDADEEDKKKGSVLIRYLRDNEECEVTDIDSLETAGGKKFKSFDELKTGDNITSIFEGNGIKYEAVVISELTPRGFFPLFKKKI